MELEVRETQGLFKMMDNGDGIISADEFVSGVLRLKGDAKSSDLQALYHDNKAISRELSPALHEKTRDIADHLNHRFSKLEHHVEATVKAHIVRQPGAAELS